MVRWILDSTFKINEVLTSPPILAFPRLDLSFILDTDASGDGIGAVLSQIQDNLERVIGYFSRTLSKAEKKYCVTSRELLAVVVSSEHFRRYLLGKQIFIRTDHASLTWLLSFR